MVVKERKGNGCNRKGREMDVKEREWKWIYKGKEGEWM